MSDVTSPSPSDAHARPTPLELRRISPAEIEIAWSDGATLRYRAALLRDKCPCATCRERRRGEQEKRDSAAGERPLKLPVLSAAEAKPLAIERVRPVGHYAYNIALSDGHDSGIFPLELLREIGQHGP
ncbi:DUF971 domain-containing protein [Candidatus Laterigemmans baculatus]|uniref:DUF971 domain-containing protein n=1 Tax=Candidatus Laterigemmans baculatus TaxID=2770505 RepID=UPI0013DC60A5|nr:DUF971 domain-containing protein [Candidatus Laterigemmans baculatus]